MLPFRGRGRGFAAFKTGRLARYAFKFARMQFRNHLVFKYACTVCADHVHVITGKTSEMVSNLVETVANLDSTFSRTDAWSRGNAKRLEERQKSLASPSAHNKVKDQEECNPLVVAGLPNRHQIRKLLLL